MIASFPYYRCGSDTNTRMGERIVSVGKMLGCTLSSSSVPLSFLYGHAVVMGVRATVSWWVDVRRVVMDGIYSSSMLVGRRLRPFGWARTTQPNDHI